MVEKLQDTQSGCVELAREDTARREARGLSGRQSQQGLMFVWTLILDQ